LHITYHTKMEKTKDGFILVRCINRNTKRFANINSTVVENRAFMQRHNLEVADPEYLIFKEHEIRNKQIEKEPVKIVAEEIKEIIEEEIKEEDIKQEVKPKKKRTAKKK
jgi:hypothetical protein